MRVRKRVLIICGLILLILYTARVIVVNKNADRVPVYIYDVGETVDFGNDYVDTVEECIDGYAVQVLGYEVVDTRELYERYNMGQADEATVKNTPFYCLLKVRIYNKDCDLGEEGGLMLDRYSLMSLIFLNGLILDFQKMYHKLLFQLVILHRKWNKMELSNLIRSIPPMMICCLPLPSR